MEHQHLDRLDQRRRYLELRVQAKKSMGWDYAYDQDECNALTWALEQLQPKGTKFATVQDALNVAMAGDRILVGTHGQGALLVPANGGSTGD